MPTVNYEVMNIALKEFSNYIDPEKKKLMILLVDNAGWHHSKNLEIPSNIEFFPLPPYTPQLQPVECTWPIFKEATGNECIKDLDDLENVLAKRCKWLMDHPEIVKGEVGFQWIQDIESSNI